MANNEIEAFFEAEAFFKAYNYLYPGNRIFYKTQTGKIREALNIVRDTCERGQQSQRTRLRCP